MKLRFLTAGESHGPALVVIVEGLPSGMALSRQFIDTELARRQGGYGRGGRMRLEEDRVRIVAGVRQGLTMGSPVSLYIENRDYDNWRDTMDAEANLDAPGTHGETRPRPGHGDLAGMLKYGTQDARDVLERASARETAARVAAGATAKRLLQELGISVKSRVISVGEVQAEAAKTGDLASFERADSDLMRCADAEASRRMVETIDSAAEEGDTLGGVFEVVVFSVVPGLGSPSQYDRRLDARLCGVLASIPGIKGVEVGEGFKVAGSRGSLAQDEIIFNEAEGITRQTNRAGGLEAGMTNGLPVILRAAMKPIPTLGKPLSTIDVANLQPAKAFKERADICAVPAASVVGEAVVALVVADAALEKFGGDSLAELMRNFNGYLDSISRLWKRGG